MTKKLTFKTNIKCNGCIATVTPFFQKNESIKKWSVDLESPDRVLTVELEGGKASEVENLIKEAGYVSEPIG
ncbi:hypothetical protein MNBD_BACTEROID06-1296 [hydrothermal vent metagenome]|uniref:HMA domain-containing protein n=1 Tax=hydrothermal vent metagenome TaxID=652676 RepID=A0A3B0UA79_9ZZZZ